MIQIFLFVLGTIIGSFLNVFALRWNTGLKLGGRSSCSTCNTQLKWWELLPVLSFFVLRGRCSKCGAKISWQYPIIEIWTGLVFATLPGINIFLLLTFSLYIAISIYDVRHKIIPDGMVYLSIFFAFIYRFLQTGNTSVDWLAGPILFCFFGAIWAISRGRAMGFGDAKLALSIGLLLGGAVSFSAIVLAFWIGAAYGLVTIGVSRITPLLRGSKFITMKSEVPFAPFIILGAWLAEIFRLDLFHVSLF